MRPWFRGAAALAVALQAVAAAADTLPVAADGQLNFRMPNARGGAQPTLTVDTTPTRGTVTSLGLFDLSALPPGAAVQKATLRLWVDNVADAGRVEVLPVLDPWDEAALTAASAPRFGVSLASFSVAASAENRHLHVDVTTLVQDWVSGATQNHGLALAGTSADPVRVRFDSKENAAESHPMEIEVVLGLPPDVGDVTSVSAGYGLIGGGNAGDLALAADPSVLQARVNAVCPAGSAMFAVDADGSVRCAWVLVETFADFPLQTTSNSNSVRTVSVIPGAIGPRELNLPSSRSGASGTLAAGETFLFGTGVYGTPVVGNKRVQCLVTTTVQVFETAAKVTNGPVVRIASKHASDAPTDDGTFGVRIPPKPAGMIAQPVSFTNVVALEPDLELTQLGCALDSPGADWVGSSVVCHTAFVCY